jgi:phage terminase large subunit
MVSAHISIIPEFVDKIEQMGLNGYFEINKNEIINKVTKSRIIFRGLKTSSGDQTANLKSLQGITTLVLDEAEELIDEVTFDKINLSIRQNGKQNRVILIMNPATKVHWIYRRFFESKGIQPSINQTVNDTTYIHTTYLDNYKHLSDTFIKEIEGLKTTNSLKFDHLIMGGWLDVAEGVIFNNWSIGEFSNDFDFGYGMDFGFSNDPSTIVKVSIDNKLKKIYLEEKLYKAGMTTDDLFLHMNQYISNEQIIADSAEPRLIEELKRKRLNIKPCTKGAGSIVEGIMLIQGYELIVSPESTNLIKELNNYIWSDKKSGTPIDMYNHILDAVRYYVTHNLKNPIMKKFKIR